MKLLFLSARLFTLGTICDFSASVCTKLVENTIEKNKPLTKKLLTFMSNFSNNSLVKWQKIEHKFIQQTVAKARSSLQ